MSGALPHVHAIVPELGETELGSLRALGEDERSLPFSEESIDFAADLARALLARPEVRTWPELAALGFFMRRAELLRLKERFDARAEADIFRAPAGLVFHVPPSNVDTIFVYSWLLALLTGNRNVVRLSDRTSPQVELLTSILCERLEDPAHKRVRDRTAMIRYGRDDAVTRALCAACDVRVVWGGDDTVNTLRAFPLQPHAQELTFPDRYSYALFSPGAVLAADAAELERLARAFANDLYWFDQLACSSPRLLFWLGTEAEADAAGEKLYPAVAEAAIGQHWGTDASIALQRFVEANTLAADGAIVRGRTFSGALTVARMASRESVDREARRGGGFLCEVALGSDVAALCDQVRRKDQTLVHYGIDAVQLNDLASRLAGRGIDRMVPVGAALDFSSVWDGFDLLDRFVRHVHVRTDRGPVRG